MSNEHNQDQTNPMRSEPIPPDLLEWARQTFNEDEYMAEVRDIRENGGLRFEDFIREIEQRIRERE